MNERILEFSEQAEKYADEWFRGEPTWSEAFESKFAELIIRECASIAGKAEYSDTWSEPVEDTIKKHFGLWNA